MTLAKGAKPSTLSTWFINDIDGKQSSFFKKNCQEMYGIVSSMHATNAIPNSKKSKCCCSIIAAFTYLDNFDRDKKKCHFSPLRNMYLSAKEYL